MTTPTNDPPVDPPATAPEPVEPEGVHAPSAVHDLKPLEAGENDRHGQYEPGPLLDSGYSRARFAQIQAAQLQHQRIAQERMAAALEAQTAAITAQTAAIVAQTTILASLRDETRSISLHLGTYLPSIEREVGTLHLRHI